MSEGGVGPIQYWFARALDARQEAVILAREGHWNGCVNRLYYATFYGVTALLAAQGQSLPRHTSVRSAFNRDFVRTGRFPTELARLFNTLFDSRQEADYTEMVRFTAEQVQPWLTGTDTFLERVREILHPPFEEGAGPR